MFIFVHHCINNNNNIEMIITANTRADIKASVELLKDKKSREYFQIKDIRIKLKVGDATGKITTQNTNRNNDALGKFYILLITFYF